MKARSLMVAPSWEIRADDLELRYARSRGPGGQNVNKVETKVELRLKLSQTDALDPRQKRRLTKKYPAHVSRTGDFIISSDRYRSRKRNLADVFERLREMLSSIRYPPPTRKKTKPSRAAKARRLREKRLRGQLKQQRRGDLD